MSRKRWAATHAICTATSATLFGLASGNPNWLKLNPLIGLAVGYLIGLAIWPLIRRATQEDPRAHA